MLPVLDTFHSACCPDEIVAATARLVEQPLDARQPALQPLASLKVGSARDIEDCIARLQAAVASRPMYADDEEKINRLLCYLLVASIRVRQLSEGPPCPGP